MIQVTIQCDLCKDEHETYPVFSENEVYRKVKESGYEWVKRPDTGTKVLVGPLCQEDYKLKKVEAETAKEKVITDWFKANATTEDNKSPVAPGDSS